MSSSLLTAALRPFRPVFPKVGALWATIVLVVAAGLPARALEVDVTQFTFDNGLQVVVIPDRRAPVVTHMIWYRVGSADEPQGKAGIAHLLEHLMFKGTDKLVPGEFSKLIRRHGGQDNAFTSKDYTGYYQRIAKDRLDLVMGLEADRMSNLKLTEKDVAPERDVVLEERRSRTDNDPSSLLSEQVDAAMYVAHPYGKPVIGWMPEVMKLDREDAMDFYRVHYTPRNAIVIVAGDVTPEEVRSLAEKHYAPLKNTAEPERVRTPEPEPIAARRVVLKDARAASPTIQRSYLAPSYKTATPGEAEALDVLAKVLGGGTTSRLYRDLVVKDRIAAYAGASYYGDGLDSGTLIVYAAPNPGGSVEPIEPAFDRIIEDIAANGITGKELERARNGLIADTVYALDNQFRLAYMFGIALTNGMSVEDVTGWTKRVEKVTAGDVQKAAQKVLRQERSVTGILLPEAPKPAAAQN